MTAGYMGKVLFVDLSTGTIKEEALDQKTCHDFIGGYGLAARIMYSRQKAGADALRSGQYTRAGVRASYRHSHSHRSPLYGRWEITADRRVG